MLIRSEPIFSICFKNIKNLIYSTDLKFFSEEEEKEKEVKIIRRERTTTTIITTTTTTRKRMNYSIAIIAAVEIVFFAGASSG